ncbi:MAG: galactose oxidase early set domain-containing protein [Pseudonocardiaceae bacterium]
MGSAELGKNRIRPEEVTYGETFSLKISGTEVGKVTWIRLPSATHDSDQSQRINDLRFRCNHGSVIITTPEQSEICPPRHYMLFVLGNAGVPSLARIMRIGRAQRPARLRRR